VQTARKVAVDWPELLLRILRSCFTS